MMRLKRWWVGLIILVAIATISLAPAIGWRLSSPPPSPNLSSSKIVTTSASPPAAKIPASFFGMHIHHAEKTWPNVPFYSWRLWDSYTTWGDLEPQAGMWKFDKLDRAVAVAAASVSAPSDTETSPLGISTTRRSVTVWQSRLARRTYQFTRLAQLYPHGRDAVQGQNSAL